MSCGTKIVYGRVEDLDAVMGDFQPDLVVARELVEHNPNTLGWMSHLAGISPA